MSVIGGGAQIPGRARTACPSSWINRCGTGRRSTLLPGPTGSPEWQPIAVDQLHAASHSFIAAVMLPFLGEETPEPDVRIGSGNRDHSRPVILDNGLGEDMDSARLCSEHHERLNEEMCCPRGHVAKAWLVEVAGRIQFDGRTFTVALR